MGLVIVFGFSAVLIVYLVFAMISRCKKESVNRQEENKTQV